MNNIFIRFYQRAPFSTTGDPGFLVNMCSAEPRRTHRRKNRAAGKRAWIFGLVALIIFSSSYPSAFVAAAVDASVPSPAREREEFLSEKDYVPGEVIVKFKNERIDLERKSGITQTRALAADEGLYVKDTFEDANLAVLKTKQGEPVESMIARLENDPNVEYVEPNYRNSIATINTDDTHRALLWALENTGQFVNFYGGTADADIDAPEAWAISEGSNNVIVAIVDTGVAYNHPDIAPNMWDGSNCKDENGNALGGCMHGYDYTDNDKVPLPVESDHGTHIAGTIAAIKNNGKGIIGVAPRAKIMALRVSYVIGSNVYIDTASAIKAIDFAIQNGAKVINASYGGYGFSQAQYDAINRFKAAGGIFVASAGNGGLDQIGDNNESMHQYPSDYDLDNIISVAATDQNDALTSFSNYGTTSVDVGAPGKNIYSTTYDAVSTAAWEENFEGVTSPALPTNWVTGGSNNTWGTASSDGTNVLFGSLDRLPYPDNTDTTVTLPPLDLRGVETAELRYGVQCETEYASKQDYIAIDVSGDGTSFTERDWWSEWYTDNDYDEDNASPRKQVTNTIAKGYLTANFQLRLRWVTNGTDNNHEGCSIDDLRIVATVQDGATEPYTYKDGTSMAAPHVVGLAALIWGYNPNLSRAQAKNIVLGTGDALYALSGKTSTGRRINAYNALNLFHPTAGFTVENVLPANQIVQAANGSGVVTINFKLKDGFGGLTVMLSNFEYSTDGGATWQAPANGDASVALSTNWNSNNYLTSVGFIGPYYFTWDTKHADTPGLASVRQEDVKIRFKVNDGAATSPFAESEQFTVDNSVDTTVITDPASSIITVNADSYTIVGTAEANALVSLYRGDTLETTQQLSSGATAFSFTVSLTQDVGNIFRVKAIDAAGNESGLAQVTILEDSTSVATSPVSIAGKIDNNPDVIPAINDTTPEIIIAGEVGMQCRWGTEDVQYASMPEENEMSVTGDRANVTLPDYSPDGLKMVYVSCRDATGNEQAIDKNLHIDFTLDTTAPQTVNPLVTPSPAGAGVVNVFFGIDGVGTVIDVDSVDSAVIAVQGLKSPYVVTFGPSAPTPPGPPPGGSPEPPPSSLAEEGEPPPSEPSPPPPPGGGGGTAPILGWGGSFVLLDEDEEATATIVVSGLKDIAGNEVAPNTVVGTFAVDTLAPTAVLVGLPQDPDTSAVPSLAVTVAGAQVVSYKYKLDNGSYSDAVSIDVPLTKTGLRNGARTLSVIGSDATGNWQDEAQATTYTWTVNDTTPPLVLGLTDDTTPKKTKIWEWDANDPSAQFQYTITQGVVFAFAGQYENTKTVTEALGTGTYYLHVQAQDNNGNESPVVTVSAIVDNTPPVITLQGDATMRVYQGTEFTDPGVTANDTVDGAMADDRIIKTIGVKTNLLGAQSITYTVTDTAGNTAERERSVIVLPLPAAAVVLAPQVTVDAQKPNVAVGANVSADAVIRVPREVTNARVDFSALVETTDSATKQATLPAAVTIESATDAGAIAVQLPSATAITAPSAWDGVVQAPRAENSASVTIAPEEGKVAVMSRVIEVGAGDMKLTLSKAARILMEGERGKLVGYSRGDVFTQITTACSADTQAAGDALPEDGDCAIDVGDDLVIWTKHFTRFATYTRQSKRAWTPSVPENVTFTIDGAPTTSTQEATLRFTYGADVTGIAVSNDADFTGAQFSAPSQTRGWTLTSGTGTKVVRAIFRNAEGGTTDRSATITLVAPSAGGGSAGGASATSIATPPLPTPSGVGTPTSALPGVGATPLPPLPPPPPPTPRVLGVESVNVVDAEKQLVTMADPRLTAYTRGKLVRRAGAQGEVWYVDPGSAKKFYIANGQSAFATLRRFGLGITNADLAKIPIAGVAQLPATYRPAFAQRLRGRILLQVESHGEAWYVNPIDGKRSYLAGGDAAYQMFQSLSVAMPSADFRRIAVGDF